MTDISTIDECVRFSRRRLDFPRQQRLAAIKKFVGVHYADQGSDSVMPVNLLELAVTIYLRLLAAKEPHCLVSTENGALRPFADDMEIVMNQLPREIRLTQTIRRAVLEAMFTIGVVKVGIAGADPRPNIGDEPFVSVVQLDDYFCDMSAKNWNEVQYEGNDYWLSTEEVKDLYGKDLCGDNYNGTGPDGDMQARSVSNADAGGELSPRVLLRDVYLVRENRMVTYAVNTLTVLRDIPWDGPEGSPYVRLCFSDVPGNLLPLPPVALWQDLNELANALYRKLADESLSSKTVAVFRGGADEDARRFCGARNGDAIRANDMPESVAVGGINQANLAFWLQNRDIFSIIAGNLDSLGGLSPQAETATQDKLINEAASARVKDMSDRVVEFASDIFRKLAWYVWTDPVRERKFRKTVSGSLNIGIDKMWTPETRDGDFLDYNFSIAVFSMQDDSPATRMQKLANVFNTFILPLAGDMANQGLYVDIPALCAYIGKNANLPVLPDFIKSMQGPPAQPMPGPAAALPQPSYISRKPPVTRRVYERVNRPGSMSERGKNAVLAQVLLGGRPQGADMAGLSMGRVM